MTEDLIDVSIIGGGIGGLAAALALQLANPHLKVKVYERDQHMSDRLQGYGLTLTNNKSGPLAKLGLLEDCINCNSTCPSNSHYTFDSAGNVIGYYGRAIKSKYFVQQSAAPRLPQLGGNEGNLRIPRQELRALLLQRLQPDTVVWGKKLLNFFENENEVEVHFDQDSNLNNAAAATIIKTKILVGADGIKSVVRNLMDQRVTNNDRAGINLPIEKSLKYIGISVIIGLSSSRRPHPLTHNRGFYVVDGTHRLFTMPFVRRRAKATASSSLLTPAYPREDNEQDDDVEEYLTMWQLSFSGLDEEQAAALKQQAAADLLQTALHRTAAWFSAVRELLSQTIPTEIWATGLFDRDPMQVSVASAGKKARWSRVTCLGDACHPMSQGANQALEDGPLLARWLGPEPPGMKRRRGAKQKGLAKEGATNMGSVDLTQRVAEENYFDTLDSTAICNRLRCFEREAVARSASKVLASREAAQYLHSPQVLVDALRHPVVEGLRDAGWHPQAQALEQEQEQEGEGDQERRPVLCQLLRAAGVHADLGALLDDALVRAVEPLIPASTDRLLCDHRA